MSVEGLCLAVAECLGSGSDSVAGGVEGCAEEAAVDCVICSVAEEAKI